VPQLIGDHLPKLLEVADLFAYAAGRALSPDPCRGKKHYEDMYRICSPILSALTYDLEKRMKNEVPDSILEARHAAILATNSGIQFPQMSPGTCIWMLGLNRYGNAYPCLMMRVPNGLGKPLLEAPCSVDFRYGMFPIKGYQLVVCLVRLPNIPLTFVTFLNNFTHQPDSPIHQLANGAELRLVLFEDRDKPIGELPFPAVSPHYWAQIDDLLAALPPFQESIYPYHPMRCGMHCRFALCEREGYCLS